MTTIIFKLLIYQIFTVFVWCSEFSMATRFFDSRSDTKLNSQDQEWISGWMGHPKWPRNIKTQNALPHMNIISGKSKEWTNFEHSRPLKRSENTLSDSLPRKAPFFGDDCNTNTSKYPCPVNVLYGNNLTVKNFFLMIPGENYSCKNHPYIEQSPDVVKFTDPQPSLEPDLNPLGAFGGQDKRVEVLTSNDTINPSPVISMATIEAVNVDMNFSLTTEALLMNSDFNSTTYLGEPINASQNYSSIQYSTISEYISKSNSELNATVDISNKSSEDVISSYMSTDRTTDDSTTLAMDTVNLITLATEASVNTSTNGVQGNITVPPDQLVTSPPYESTRGNASLRDEILRTVDKYCETLSFNLTNDNGTYPVNPVYIPQQIRLNDFTDRKLSMKRQIPRMIKSKRTLPIKNYEKNKKK